MRQRPRRSLNRAAAAGFALTAAGVSAAASLPASASQPAPHYTADASAGLVRVAAIDGSPLAVRGHVADLRVASSECSTDSTRAMRSVATSTHLSATIAGQHVSEVPRNIATQTAGPDHTSPELGDGPALNIGLARAGLGRLRAHARWNAGLAHPSGPAMLAESAGAIASLKLLPTAGLPVPVPFLGTAAASIHKTAYSQCRNSLVAVDGQSGLGVAASARVSATAITLFGGTAQQHTVRVISPPSLTVIAAGTSRSSVRYIAPIVEVIDTSGNVHRIDAPDQTVDIPLTAVPHLPGITGSSGTIGGPTVPANGFDLTAIPGVGDALAGPGSVAGGAAGTTATKGKAPASGLDPGAALPALPGMGDPTGVVPTGALGGGGGGSASRSGSAVKPALVRLSLGELTEQLSPTAVTADVSTIRLELLTLDAHGPLLSIGIGDLHAASTAPAGGVPSAGQPGSSPSPEPGEDGDPEAQIPGGGSDPEAVTGSPHPGSASVAGDPADPGGGSAGSSSLPVTGTSIGLLLAAGVGLVLIGRFAVLMARRRLG